MLYPFYSRFMADVPFHFSSSNSPSSSTTWSNDNALAEYRVEIFMLDTKDPINATLALRPNHNVAAEALELAAEKRMEAELLVFDDTFNQSTTRTT
jgi:hypothetical protein